jgi:outer membrane protein assembly factor BamB/serine/threonine protein kinase
VAVFEELTAGDPRRVGRYRIVARLGAGGMGQVYLGRSPGGRAVAVKVVRPELAQDPDFRRRFAREVAAARRVNGVFTAGVVDADAEGTPAWLATSYVPGMSLGEAVSAHGRWPAEPVRALGAALAEALEAIHGAGVIHRDLKPSNVLLAADGPRVIDFGISVVGGASALTSTGMVVGTPGFMAPEQVVGGPVGPACDVFALGAVLAYTATGTPPYGTGPAHAVNFRAVYEEPDLTAVPPVLRDLVESCLAKEAALRPCLPELLEQLTDVDGDDPVTALSLADTNWLPAPVARNLRTRLSAQVPAAASPAAVAAPPESESQAEPEFQLEPESQPEPSALAEPTEQSSPSAPPETTATVTLKPAAASAPAPFRPSRRHLLLAAAGVTAAAGVSAALAATAERYDTDSHPPSGTAGKTTSKWTVSLPQDITGQPTLAGGLVYAVTKGGPLWALDAATGTQQWTAVIESGTDAPGLAVTGGTAYLAGARSVRALDAATGRRTWSFSAASELNGRLRVADGTVYTGGDLAAYAIDAASGTQRWKLRRQDSLAGDPPIADGMTYIAARGTVYAVDAATGKRRWTFVADGDLGTSPTLVRGLLVLGGLRWDNESRGQLATLYALDPATGRARWKIRTPHGLRSLTAAGGLIYAGVLQDAVYALDVGTGRQRWSFRTGNFDNMDPVVAGDTVYVGRQGNHLTALDAVTGTKRWDFSATNTLWAEPVVSDGVLYVAEQTGTLSVLDAATGSRLWSLETHSPVKYPPLVAMGALYLAAGPKLHALPL